MIPYPSLIKYLLPAVLLVFLLLPAAASAQEMCIPDNSGNLQNCQPVGPPPPSQIDLCNTNLGYTSLEDSAYTEKVVDCLRGSIVNSTVKILDGISTFMKPVVGAMVTFAIVVLGIRILGGERHITRSLFGFLLRLGLVLMFAFNLGGLAGSIFGIADQLTALVSTGDLTPWQQIDIFIGKIFGFAPQLALFQGLLGIIGGALVSSTMGIILFISGFVAILEILTFIIRTVFTYLTAYLVLAFMIIISPLIIPMALFFYTERYFQKWTAMVIASLITPMLLTAFLGPFLGVFMVLVANIFATLGFPCPQCTDYAHCDLTMCQTTDFRAYEKLNQPLFSWLVPGDASFDQVLTSVTKDSLSDPAVQSNINPTLRRAMDTGANVPGIDFGSNNIAIIQQLVFQFISLWIFASLIKSMVTKIPDIAASIAATASGISMDPFSFKRAARESVQDFGIGLANFGVYKAGGLRRL